LISASSNANQPRRGTEYLLDGEGRRLGKKRNGALINGFLYDGRLRPIAELDGAGAVVATFVYALHSNVPEYMNKGGVDYRIVTDTLGSPRLVLRSSDGSIMQRMDYDEFGNIVLDTNPGFQPYGFAGGLWDADTGLVHFGAREYDPAEGRWTTTDPIRFQGGGTNLYVYVRNDPVNREDPTGLKINVSSPDLDSALQDLMANPELAPLIDQINSSSVTVDIENWMPAPDWLVDLGGAATGRRRDGSVDIILDLAAVNQYFSDCGSPLTFNLEQLVAHELGHAFDLIFRGGFGPNSSVDFENAVRTAMKRVSEYIPCKCKR
jgi:RHS repeat-associated protein